MGSKRPRNATPAGPSLPRPLTSGGATVLLDRARDPGGGQLEAHAWVVLVRSLGGDGGADEVRPARAGASSRAQAHFCTLRLTPSAASFRLAPWLVLFSSMTTPFW